MMVTLRISMAALLFCALACSDSGDGNKRPAKKSKKTDVIGIDPMLFKCDHLVTAEELSATLGGKVTVAEVAFEPAPGTVEPCNYVLTLTDGETEVPTQQAWSFDLDCRKDAMKTAVALFEQYESGAAHLKEKAEEAKVIEAEEAKAEKKKPKKKPKKAEPDEERTEDEPPPPKPIDPESLAPKRVEVGKRGLDHHGQAILFVDDDAPCFVRVRGPTPENRLKMARLIAKQLTPKTAPMPPTWRN